MATFTRIEVKKQSCGRMLGALSYVLQGHKVGFEGGRVENGVNCLPYTSYLEMMTTKEKFKKTGDVCFYHFVQSFSVTAFRDRAVYKDENGYHTERQMMVAGKRFFVKSFFPSSEKTTPADQLIRLIDSDAKKK